MKKVTLFYLKDCPYCRKALSYIDELRAEDSKYAEVEFEMIEEDESPDIIANYDYQAVPCFYFGDKKAFEAYFLIPDAKLRAGVKSVLDEAVR